jgi:hypothetical protein
MKIWNVLILSVIATLALSPLHASAQTVYIEGENYSGSHDIAYEIIREMPGPSCSGGYWLVGLDYPDEWVQYELPISSFGYYLPSLRAQADMGSSFQLNMTVYPPKMGDPQTVTFNFTGNGYS